MKILNVSCFFFLEKSWSLYYYESFSKVGKLLSLKSFKYGSLSLIGTYTDAFINDNKTHTIY